MTRAAHFALGFAVSAAYLPWLPQSSAELRWVLAALLLPLCLWRAPLRFNAMPHAALAALLLWALCTSLWSAAPFDAGWRALCLLTMALAYWLGSVTHHGRALYAGLCTGVAVSSLLVIPQLLGWSAIPQWAAPAGLFFNRNFLAELAVPLFLLALLRLWFWSALALLPSVALTQSRGALVALATGLVYCRFGPRWSAAVFVVGCVAVVATGAWHDGGGASLLHRINLWHDTLAAWSWLGHGLGSFPSLYPAFTQWDDTLALRSDHAHSDLFEALFETGVVGAGLFVAAACMLLPERDRTPEGAALVAAGVLALVAFPSYLPGTGILFAFLAGRVAGGSHPLGDGYDEWRAYLVLRQVYANHGGVGGPRIPGGGSEPAVVQAAALGRLCLLEPAAHAGAKPRGGVP